MLIGVSGWAGHGKDSIGKILIEQHDFVRFAFADEVRKAVLILDPWIPAASGYGGNARLSDYLFNHRLGDWNRAKKHPEVRRLLQYMGTNLGRRFFGENIWIDRMESEVRECLDADGNVVITDVRFPNEANWIRHEMDGNMLRVVRKGMPAATAPDGTIHESELALENYDFDAVIHNDGTLDGLALLVHALVQRQ